MMGLSRLRWLAAIFLFFGLSRAEAASPATIRVLADDYPPFLLKSAGGLSGPYADAFRLLMHKAGIEVVFQSVPFKRAFLSLANQDNTCALAVNFDQGESETVNFISVIAPITLTAYKRGDNKTQLTNLGGLKGYSVGAVDMAEVRDILSSAGMPFTPVKNSSTGFLMLNAGRFQVLVSDLPPDSLSGKNQAVKLFVVAQVERWLACGPRVSPALQGRMRAVLKQGLFAEDAAPVWKRYGMLDYYREMRKSWLKAP
jgi:ABC-type amino acid transport substrate-binding protein